MNDFMNQIPKMLVGEELLRALTFLPEYNENIRNAGTDIRLQKLSEIYQIYIPTSMSVEVYSKLYLAMVRNLNKKCDSKGIKSTYVGINNGENFSIIGDSGLGKSSSVDLSLILCGGNKVLDFENSQYSSKIIPMISCQCPHDCSIKQMLLSILQQTDFSIGSNYYEKAVQSKASVDILIGTVAHKVASHHTAVIIIDEMQNVLNNVVNGQKLMMALTQLINSAAGVSLVMVGTPILKQLFESDIKLARRSVGLTYNKIPYGAFFVNFCRTLYQYQYVKNKSDLDDGMIRLLYQYSDGNLSILKELFYDAQELAILNQSESLDSNAFRIAYSQRMDMLHIHMATSLKKQTNVIKNDTQLPESMFAGETAVKRNNINEIILNAKKYNQNSVDNLKSVGLLMEVAI
nr:ATP-binding protein [uncultured Anaerosporobacter sp.]